jgi:hypothetical protein
MQEQTYDANPIQYFCNPCHPVDTAANSHHASKNDSSLNLITFYPRINMFHEEKTEMESSTAQHQEESK